MNLLSPQNIFNGSMFLVVVSGVIANAINARSTKKSTEDSDALTTIKIKDLAIETLKEENAEIKQRLQKQGERVAVLEADNKRLSDIVSNRDPELAIFMKNTSSSLLLIEKSLEALLKAQSTNNSVVINK